MDKIQITKELEHLKSVIKIIYTEVRQDEATDYNRKIRSDLGKTFADIEGLINLINDGETKYLKNKKLFEGK